MTAVEGAELTLDRCTEVLAEIWGELLGAPRFRAEDDFFALGGHSVAATRMMARVRATLRVNLPATAVFSTPTLGALAERVVAASALRPTGDPAPVGGIGTPVLSPAQRRQWFLEQFSSGSASYNIPIMLRLIGPTDTAALRAAVQDLVARHDILRARYPEQDGQPRPVIDPAGRVAVGMVRVPQLRLDSWLRAEARRLFDLATQPAFRATICRIDRADHVLAMTVHHIAADGWSRGVVLDELSALYAFHCGLGPAPPPDPVQYADLFVLAEDQDGVGWWVRRLSGAPDHTTFPADRPRPDILTDAGATIPLEFDAQMSQDIRTWAKATRTTTYTVLMAALHLLLAQETGETDTVVATSVAGREEWDAESVIGCFINTVAVRIDQSGDPTVRELLRRVWESTVEALGHSGVSFDLVVRELGVERDLAYRPVFQVMLTVHNEPPLRPAMAGLEVRWLDIDNGGAKCDTFFSVVDDGGPLHGSLTYRTQLYDPPTARRLARRYIALLAELVAEPDRRVTTVGRPAEGA